MSSSDGANADAVLTHPFTLGDVHIVGSAHISRASAIQAEALVRGIRPRYTAVELDEDRLRRMIVGERDEQSRVARAEVGVGAGQTLSEVISLTLRGKITQHVGALTYAAAGAVLGSSPGAEFLAARKAAEQVGSEVICIDRSADVTIARVMAAVGQAASVKPSAPPTTSSSSSASGCDQRRRGDDGMLAAMEEAGCAEPNLVVEAAKRVLRAAMQGDEIQPDDLMQMRVCGTKMVESSRVKALKSTGGPVADAFLGLPDMEKEQGRSRDFYSAVFRVIADERDAIMAHRLAQLAERAAGEPVVAVVGAAHVNGITRKWQDACMPEYGESVKPLLAMPSSNAAPAVTATLAIVTGVMVLARRFPRFIAASSGVATGGALVGGLIAARGAVQVEAATRRLVEASRALPPHADDLV